MLNITDIRIRLVNKEDNKLKAIASITIDGCFVVHEIRVLNGTKGYFVGMPRKKNPADDTFKDIVHPINPETREALDRQILEAYEKAVKEAPAEQE